MSVDRNSFPSPPSSEGGSGTLPRPRTRVTEDVFKKDKNYRRYAASVERALSLFDTALQEWADYISFLSRLLKALQGRPQNLSVVPSKGIVAKRLAQCLKPSLPSGVHQKALEVYSYIFSLLKPESLAQDLPLYLPGIAPTLTFASLSVRPLFLSLVETHLLGLDPSALRPALKSIILALLPGLEEETSDDFETTLRIMNKFRQGYGQAKSSLPEQDVDADSQYFWQCLFLASITNPSRRLGVLAYFSRHMPKLGVDEPRSVMGMEDAPPKSTKLPSTVQFLISPEPGLLIRCFAAGLSDDQLLVQRNFLDLLVTHLPLHSPVLQNHITAKDFEMLVAAAAGVVTRRDMSLNRRLWAWFLGPDSSADEKGSEGNNAADNDGSASFKSQYFSNFGLKPLVQSMKNMIDRDTLVPQERARPFRIALSLMDRWEVGGLVVPEIFLALLDSVKRYEEQATSKTHFDEVFRSSSAFFDGVESSLIFSELLGLLDLGQEDTDAHADQSTRNLRLAGFILSNFNVREEEMLLVHVPLITLALLTKMGASTGTEQTNGSSPERHFPLDLASKIATQLIDLLPERAFLRRFRSDSAEALAQISQQSGKNGREVLLGKIKEFYAQTKDNLDLPPLPFSPKAIAELILREGLRLVLSALERHNWPVLRERSNLFISLLKKAPKSRILSDGRLFQAMSRQLASQQPTDTTLSFSMISSITSLTTSLYSTHTTGFYINYEQICDLTPILVPRLWDFLSPLSPKFHVEAVRCLWNLHFVSWQDHLVEASVASLMIQPSLCNSSHLTTVDQVERYFVLWNHSHQANFDLPSLRMSNSQNSAPRALTLDRSTYQSALLDRPLFIVLDLLSQPSLEGSQAVREWLQELSSAHKIFEIIVSKLDAMSSPNPGESESTSSTRAIALDNVKECTYLFRAISNILPALSHAGWNALTSHTVAVLEKNQDSATEDSSESISLQSAIMHYSLRALYKQDASGPGINAEEASLQQTALTVVRQFLSGPGAEQLLDLNLDVFLIDRLSAALDENNSSLQASVIDTLLPALKNQFSHRVPETPPPLPAKHRRAGSRETLASISQLSLNALNSDKTEKDQQVPFVQPPQQLLDCLLKGISSSNSHPVIEKWVLLLCECLPLYSGGIFQILLMLVECFCREIKASYHQLQLVFRKTEGWSQNRPEHVTISLLSGLENCIGRAHERLTYEEAAVSSGKSPDPAQGFFGNMVSGVFTAEGSQGRNATANNRLTVLLCFQDAVRLCFSIWAWGSAGRSGQFQDTESLASFQYTSLRMRNRSRRILEHLFAAEALECLETLIELWCNPAKPENSTSIFNLLHTLDGSRPKITVPALFNAIYSRTNPAALDPRRKSAMTSSLTETDLVAFLVTYARSLDDDVLDEIWADCTTFLRDVLANPFPHRQILPRLMEFAAIIGEKMENTNFSEDRRIRKELGDLLLRLLTAIFTSKPMGLSHDAPLPPKPEKPLSDHEQNSQQQMGPDDVLSILVTSMPAFITTLGESDRIVPAMSSISGNIISPLFRSRLFPQCVNHNALNILQQMTKVPSASKLWKKDVGDAFNDARFFGTHLDIVRDDWLGLLRQWVLVDKDRLPELLTRLTPPTTAGIMFGVGASAARLEADRKAQLNLRRIAVLVLAADDDHFAAELSNLQQKLEDLLAATNVSSPSSATRAEIFMVLRALVLKTSTIHLAPFWPVINTELQEAVSSIMPSEESEAYNPHSLLQACKLLDTLLLTAPDDFQLQEWLFVTDTTDAVYPPDRWEPVALAHEVSHSFGPGKVAPASNLNDGTIAAAPGYKRPWLMSDSIRDMAKDEIVDRVLRPFFDRLSIHAFESTYSMGVPDVRACRDDLLADLFDEGTMES